MKCRGWPTDIKQPAALYTNRLARRLANAKGPGRGARAQLGKTDIQRAGRSNYRAGQQLPWHWLGMERPPNDKTPANLSLGRPLARRSLGTRSGAVGPRTWRPLKPLLGALVLLLLLAFPFPVWLGQPEARPASGDDNLTAQLTVRRLPSAASAAAPTGQSEQISTTSSSGGTNSDDDLNSTLAMVLGSGRTEQLPEGQPPEAKGRHLRLGLIRRLLVRQLTNLIMNNEPEIIADQMEGAKVSGSLSNEPLATDQQASKPSPMELGTESGKTEPLSSPPGEATNQDEPEPANRATDGLELADDQYPTCPPDYEDQPIGGDQAGGGLSADGQQQLMAGAESSGLLSIANNSNGSQTTGDRPPCYQPGSRMIEVITKVITPILFSIIIVVGLLGNIIVMIVILEDRKTERELTPTGLLILDLSLADLSFIIFCIPFTGWDYSVGHWVFGSTWCKMNQYLIVVCALSSIYTLVLMSVDRFMAIVYPIECMSYRTSKNTLYAIYIKWIIILILALPTISMHGIIDSPLAADQYTCRFLADQYNPLHFQVVFFVTSYLFPLILIFCLYLSLLNKLWFGSRPQGHKESTKTLESKKKVTWLVASIVVVFALCWCPIQVMLILMRLKMHKITATYVAIQVFSHTLGYMNSCVNPIVYAFASESFLNSFKRSACGRFFYWLFCLKNSHHHQQQQQQQQHTHLMSHTNIPPTQIDLEGFIDSTNLQRRASNPQQQTNHRLKVPGLHQEAGNGSLERLASSSSPLEPRDRPTIIRQQVHSSSINRPNLTRNSSQQFEVQHQQPQQQINPSNGQRQINKEPTKQQLVARMAQSGSQVSHRCEPCFKE